MITFALRFPAIWLSETYARSHNLSRLTCKQYNTIHICYLPAQVGRFRGKLCPRSWVWPETTRPRAQFFPLRTSRPVNNIYVLYCIVLYCIVLYCIVLYCIALHCITLRGTAFALHCIAYIKLNCALFHDQFRTQGPWASWSAVAGFFNFVTVSTN